MAIGQWAPPAADENTIPWLLANPPPRPPSASPSVRGNAPTQCQLLRADPPGATGHAGAPLAVRLGWSPSSPGALPRWGWGGVAVRPMGYAPNYDFLLSLCRIAAALRGFPRRKCHTRQAAPDLTAGVLFFPFPLIQPPTPLPPPLSHACQPPERGPKGRWQGLEERTLLHWDRPCAAACLCVSGACARACAWRQCWTPHCGPAQCHFFATAAWLVCVGGGEVE